MIKQANSIHKALGILLFFMLFFSPLVFSPFSFSIFRQPKLWFSLTLILMVMILRGLLPNSSPAYTRLKSKDNSSLPSPLPGGEGDPVPSPRGRGSGRGFNSNGSTNVIYTSSDNKGKLFHDYPLRLLIIPGIIIAALNIAFSSHPLLSAKYYCIIALFFYLHLVVAVDFSGIGSRRYLLIGMLSGAVISSIYSIMQFMDIEPIFERAERVKYLGSAIYSAAFMGQPTLLAGYLCVMPFIFLWLAMRASKRWHNIAGLLGFMLTTASLFVTQSRGAFVGYGVGMVALTAILLRYRISRRAVGFIIAMMLCFIVASSAYIATNKDFRAKIMRGIKLKGSYSAATRIFFWRVAFEMMRERPIIGVGLGRYGYHYYDVEVMLHREGKTSLATAKDAMILQAHNEFIQVAAELGALGFLLFLAFNLGIFKVGLRKLSLYRGYPPDQLFQACLLSALICLLTYSLFSFPLHIAPSALNYVVIGAMLSGRGKIT